MNPDGVVVSVVVLTDMRKALPRDVDKKSIIPLPHPVTPDQL